jgi:regulator of cell morphogenesis and NO signaling
MHTSLHVDGANCPICYDQTLDALGHLDGVRAVRGSIAGPCIEIEHDEGVADSIVTVVRDRLHGVELFANEIRMMPIEPVAMSAPCPRHPSAQQGVVAPEPHGDEIVASMTLADIVTTHPSLAADLERRGLDYCCHGARTLEDAAVARGLDPDTVAGELSAASSEEAPEAWPSFGPVDLVVHIEAVHHRYLWSELPRLSALIDKILAVHGARHPELAEVQGLFNVLRADLEPHLRREEQVLFPMIRRLGGPLDPASPGAEHLSVQIETFASEHETVGALLDELRGATGGYAPPADGCATYAACYRALAELEADTHLHVHKENNLLFSAPRARPPARPEGRTNP